MKKQIKKLGYGIAIHFNEYTKKFEVYKLGSYYPGNGIKEDSVFISNKSLKKAVKKYHKKFLTH
jgi:hypothetical protein